MTQKIWTRDFFLICSAQFVFSVSSLSLVPTLPIYLSRLGSKEGEIGLLIGVLTITSLMIRPFVGRGLAKIPEKRFLIAGTLTVGTCCIAYLFAFPFLPFFFLRMLHGIGHAFFSTAAFTYVVNLIPQARRGQSVSYYYMSMNLAVALGPAFGMLIINEFSFAILFLVSAALSLCSLSVTLGLAKAQDLRPKSQVLEKQPILNREALPPATMALISNTIWGALTAFFPLFAVMHGVSNPGVFFTVLAGVLILVRGFGGKILDLYSKEKLVPPCLAAQILAMLILAFSTTLPMFLLAAVVWGMGSAFLYPLLLVTAVERAGSSSGPAMGTYTALFDLGTGMGSVVMGIVVQWTNYRTMFLCLALSCVINLLIFQLIREKKGAEGHAYL